MTLNTENGLDLMCRLRPAVDAIDDQLLDQSMVYVINTFDSTLIDTNAFIHYICKNIFNKYYKRMVKTSRMPSHEDMSGGNSSPQVSLESNPIVIVFECMDELNLRHFSDVITSKRQLKDVDIYQCIDESQLLASLSTQLALEVAFNGRLQLVVIYSHSSNIYPHIVDKINKILFSSVLTIRVVLVVDRITKRQSNDYLNNTLFQTLTIKSNDRQYLEIKSDRNDGIVLIDITK